MGSPAACRHCARAAHHAPSCSLAGPHPVRLCPPAPPLPAGMEEDPGPLPGLGVAGHRGWRRGLPACSMEHGALPACAGMRATLRHPCAPCHTHNNPPHPPMPPLPQLISAIISATVPVEGDRGWTSFVMLILELQIVVWMGYYSDRNAGDAVAELAVGVREEERGGGAGPAEEPRLRPLRAGVDSPPPVPAPSHPTAPVRAAAAPDAPVRGACWCARWGGRQVATP